MKFFLSALQEAGFVKCDFTVNVYFAELTARGWNRIAELETATPTKDSKQAFVAMWFDHSLDKAYSEGIAKAIDAAGFKAMGGSANRPPGVG